MRKLKRNEELEIAAGTNELTKAAVPFLAPEEPDATVRTTTPFLN